MRKKRLRLLPQSFFNLKLVLISVLVLILILVVLISVLIVVLIVVLLILVVVLISVLIVHDYPPKLHIKFYPSTRFVLNTIMQISLWNYAKNENSIFYFLFFPFEFKIASVNSSLFLVRTSA